MKIVLSVVFILLSITTQTRSYDYYHGFKHIYKPKCITELRKLDIFIDNAGKAYIVLPNVGYLYKILMNSEDFNEYHVSYPDYYYDYSNAISIKIINEIPKVVIDADYFRSCIHLRDIITKKERCFNLEMDNSGCSDRAYLCKHEKSKLYYEILKGCDIGEKSFGVIPKADIDSCPRIKILEISNKNNTSERIDFKRILKEYDRRYTKLYIYYMIIIPTILKLKNITCEKNYWECLKDRTDISTEDLIFTNV